MGTSKDTDAREYFSAMEKHMIPFAKTQEGERDLIDMAFNKKKADDRKDWLRQFKVRSNTVVAYYSFELKTNTARNIYRSQCSRD